MMNLRTRSGIVLVLALSALLALPAAAFAQLPTWVTDAVDDASSDATAVFAYGAALLVGFYALWVVIRIVRRILGMFR